MNFFPCVRKTQYCSLIREKILHFFIQELKDISELLPYAGFLFGVIEYWDDEAIEKICV